MVAFEFTALLLIIASAAWLLSYGAETFAEKYGRNFAGSILLGLITTLPRMYAAGDPRVRFGCAIGHQPRQSASSESRRVVQGDTN